MIFNNDQISTEWQDHWRSKENALRNRLVKNCERLTEHSKPLKPLREGDAVLIQNPRNGIAKALWCLLENMTNTWSG